MIWLAPPLMALRLPAIVEHRPAASVRTATRHHRYRRRRATLTAETKLVTGVAPPPPPVHVGLDRAAEHLRQHAVGRLLVVAAVER